MPAMTNHLLLLLLLLLACPPNRLLQPFPPDVLEVGHKLLWEALAEALEACLHFLLTDLLILLLLGGSLQTLPG